MKEVRSQQKSEKFHQFKATLCRFSIIFKILLLLRVSVMTEVPKSPKEPKKDVVEGDEKKRK